MASIFQLMADDTASSRSQESNISLKEIDQGLEDIERMIRKLQDELIGLHSVTYNLTTQDLNAYYSRTKLSKTNAFIHSNKSGNSFERGPRSNNINRKFCDINDSIKCKFCGNLLYSNSKHINAAKVQVLFNKMEKSKLKKNISKASPQNNYQFTKNNIAYTLAIDAKMNTKTKRKQTKSTKRKSYTEAIETIDDLQKKYSEIYYDCQSTLNLCNSLKRHIEAVQDSDEESSNKKPSKSNIEQVWSLNKLSKDIPKATCKNDGANVIQTLDNATKAIDEVQRRCSDIWFDCIETLNICKSLKQIKLTKSDDKGVQVKKGIICIKTEEKIPTNEKAIQIKANKGCKCNEKLKEKNSSDNIPKSESVEVVNLKEKFSITKIKKNPRDDVSPEEKQTQLKERIQRQLKKVPVHVANKTNPNVYPITEESSDFSDHSDDSVETKINLLKSQNKVTHLTIGEHDIEVQYLYEEEDEETNEKLEDNPTDE